MPVDCSSRYTERPSHRGHARPAGKHGPRSGVLFVAPHARPAQPRPAALRGGEASGGALGGELALELSETGEDSKREPACRATCVDLLVQGAQGDVARSEPIHSRDEMREGSAEPVESPYDEGVAGGYGVEGVGEAGAGVEGAGGRVGVDTDTAGGVEGVELHVEGLIGRRDPRVADGGHERIMRRTGTLAWEDRPFEQDFWSRVARRVARCPETVDIGRALRLV